MQVGKVSFNGAEKPLVENITNVSASVSTSAEKYLQDKAVNKELSNLMPKAIKTINRMSKFTGEVPNIIINALGTGLVAPIFIKYNFLSKTDDDTRTYSALRQPISAVLSVATQVGLLIPFNRVMDNMSNKGEFSQAKYNKTGFEDVSYIKRQLKKENPKLSSKELDEMAKQKHMYNLAQLEKDVTEHDIIKCTANGKQSQLAPEDVKKLLEQTTDDMMKNIKTNITRYETEKLGKQMHRGEFYRNNSKIVKDVLKDIDEGIGSKTDEKVVAKWFKNKIKDMTSKKENKELISLVTEISQRPDVTTIKDKVAEVKEKCAEFENCKSMEEVGAKVTSKLSADKDALVREKAAIEEMQAAIKKMDPAVKNSVSIKKIAEIAKKVPDSSFVYDVVQKHISHVGANQKGLNQITGLVISLAILPITCSLLNYLYPKFMDFAFPHLSDKKKPKHDDTFEKAVSTATNPGYTPNSDLEVRK